MTGPVRIPCAVTPEWHLPGHCPDGGNQREAAEKGVKKAFVYKHCGDWHFLCRECDDEISLINLPLRIAGTLAHAHMWARHRTPAVAE